MEAHSSTVENGESNENPDVGYVGDVAEEDEESIKKNISSHPLFGLLIDGESNKNPDVGYVGDVAEEDEESIKKKISSHPLFGRLIEAHLKCLKVGLGELGEVGTTNAANQANFNPKATIPRSSELDRFMEAYCVALGNLKEAMGEPQQEMASFIDAMYFQLERSTNPTQINNNPKSRF